MLDLGLTDKQQKKLFRSSKVKDYFMDRGNLEEPLNRFLSFTIMYVLFVCLIVTCLFNPVINPERLRNNFQWYHQLSLTMTGSLLLQDVYSLYTCHASITGLSFRFWKVYDIMLDVSLVSAFVVRFLMGGRHECPDEECDAETLEARYDIYRTIFQNNLLNLSLHAHRLPYDTLSNCFFAVATIMACTRFLYWFQLEDKMGPIIIQLSRVIIDVFTFILVLVVLLVSFTMALVPLKAINTRCDNYTDVFYEQEATTVSPGASSRIITDPLGEDGCWFVWDEDLFVSFFWNILGLIFWGILNPEYPDSEFDADSAEGMFAIAIYAFYCVIAIIILLNLLVAIMNNTIQRVHDRKNVYWKFVRATIWIEFFGDAYSLPPPFGIYVVGRAMVIATVNFCRRVYREQKWKKEARIFSFRKSRRRRRKRLEEKEEDIDEPDRRETVQTVSASVTAEGNAMERAPPAEDEEVGVGSVEEAETRRKERRREKERRRRLYEEIVLQLIERYWEKQKAATVK